jgi:hypothetical protein
MIILIQTEQIRGKEVPHALEIGVIAYGTMFICVIACSLNAKISVLFL